jgi:acyl transferase domain-containing protein/acyl carrier protein
MLADGVPAHLASDPHYVPVAGYLNGAELFDAGFFHMPPKEARQTDPQQRLLLECAYHALGDAGYGPATAPGAVSVYAGTGANTHFWRDLEHAGGDPSKQFLAYVANDKDFAATRIAFKLGLNGAAVTVQTACSTGLVATHLACQSLLLGESDMALAGACSLRLPRKAGYLYEPGGIESPDGHCRPFDSQAAGTVFSDGVAMLALRRLDDAVADGDRIYAVIKGSAVNNDGGDKAGFTAPSEAGQIGVITEALAVSGYGPEDLSFIEAHGTGTALGDAVEIGALATVFRGSARSSPCPIGSVKANIGHTDTVSGTAGLIKTAMALKHGILPPQTNFTAANPQLGLADRGFSVNSAATRLTGRRVAGVSSFGIGGSNVHMIVEAAPERQRLPRTSSARLFTIGAASDAALDRRIDDIRRTIDDDGLPANQGPELDDLAFTLRRTDGRLPLRAFAVTSGAVASGSAQPALKGSAFKRAPASAPPVSAGATSARRTAFLFPGQGAQYPGMGRGLYENFASYRATIDSAAEVLRPELGADLRALLFEGSEDDLAQTRLTQPLVFASDLACARLLATFGINPETVIGHSLGEYAAACFAGVMSFEDGLRLVARRGSLMQALPTGLMLAVAASPEIIEPYLSGDVGIAGLNAPESTVLSGPTDQVEAVARALENAGIVSQPLATSHAFHSTMMDPMLDVFRREIERVELRAPKIPLISNLTGAPITDAEATSPDYWCRHLSEPVRFVEGLSALLSGGGRVLIETGPGQVLSSLARRHPLAGDDVATLALMRHPYDERDDAEVLLETVGSIWSSGTDIDWSPLDRPGDDRVADTPPYPFARDRHWLEPVDARPARSISDEPSADLPELPELLIPCWRRDISVATTTPVLPGSWVIADDGSGLAEGLAREIGARGGTAIIRPSEELDTPLAADTAGVVLAGQNDIFRHIATVARLVEARQESGPLTVGWLATGLFDVTGTESLEPESAMALGAMRCLPLEQPSVSCLIADADDPLEAVALIANDLAAPRRDAVVAYRAGRRWHPAADPFDIDSIETAPSDPHITGPVLITGGFGSVGRLAAEAVAEMAAPGAIDIYLMSRSGTPSLPSRHGSATLHGIIGDAGDETAIVEAVREIVARHGRIAGVIHAAGTLDPAGFEPLSGNLDGALDRAVALHRRGKIDGVHALIKALSGADIDFCLLVSSLSTRLGGIGYAAYAGANAVLDAVADSQAQKGLRWLSADLDGFDFSVENPAPNELNRETGRRAFVRLINAARDGVAGSVIVSATPFKPRYSRWNTAATQGISVEFVNVQAPAGNAQATSPTDGPTSKADPFERAWSDVLGIEDISEDGNFFELGGSSLSALQLIAQLRRTTGLQISLGEFLLNPTLDGLRSSLTDANRAEINSGPSAAAAELQIADRSQPLPTLPGQRRIWIAEQMNPERSNFAVEAAYRVTGPLNAAALKIALSALSDKHEPLRTRFVTIDGEPYQRIEPESSRDIRQPDILSIVDVSAEPSEFDVDEATAAFFSKPFDLAAEAPWRALLIRKSPDSHLLLIAVHHIVVDDWSIGLILEDLGAFYQAACEGPVTVEPAVPQFADICLHRSNMPDLPAEIAFWRDTLHDAPTTPPLKPDAEASSADAQSDGGYEGGVVRIGIPAERVSAVRSAASKHRTTPFVWLLSAFEIALAGLGGQRDLVVGTPLAGRTEPGTDRMVGYFVNPAALRTTVSDESAFGAFVERSAQVVAAAHANGTTPFEHVQDALGMSGDAAPPFRVWFTLLTHALPRGLGTDLTIEPEIPSNRPARFPIALILEPDGAGLIGHLEFARSSYLEETIGVLAESFKAVLENSLNEPQTRISELVALCERIRADHDAARESQFIHNQRNRLTSARRTSARRAKPARPEAEPAIKSTTKPKKAGS